MKEHGYECVEVVEDLCRYCNGFHVLILYLLVCGYSQAEVAQMLNISRQALFHETNVIRMQYHEGRKLNQRSARQARDKAKQI